MTSAERSMSQMTSGECRWIGREDLHVYCWGPMSQPRVYKIWTIDSIGSVWDDEGWTDATTVAKQIAAISRRAGT